MSLTPPQRHGHSTSNSRNLLSHNSSLLRGGGGGASATSLSLPQPQSRLSLLSNVFQYPHSRKGVEDSRTDVRRHHHHHTPRRHSHTLTHEHLGIQTATSTRNDATPIRTRLSLREEGGRTAHTRLAPPTSLFSSATAPATETDPNRARNSRQSALHQLRRLALQEEEEEGEEGSLSVAHHLVLSPSHLRSPTLQEVCTPPSDITHSTPSSPVSRLSPSSTGKASSLVSSRATEVPYDENAPPSSSTAAQDQVTAQQQQQQREVSIVEKHHDHERHKDVGCARNGQRGDGLVDATHVVASEGGKDEPSMATHWKKAAEGNVVTAREMSFLSGSLCESCFPEMAAADAVADPKQEWALAILQEAEGLSSAITARHGQLLRELLSPPEEDICEEDTAGEGGRTGSYLGGQRRQQQQQQSTPPSQAFHSLARLRSLELAIVREQQTLSVAENLLRSLAAQRQETNQRAGSDADGTAEPLRGKEGPSSDAQHLAPTDSAGWVPGEQSQQPDVPTRRYGPQSPYLSPTLSSSFPALHDNMKKHLHHAALAAHRRCLRLQRLLLIAQEEAARGGLAQLAAAALFTLAVHFVSDPAGSDYAEDARGRVSGAGHRGSPGPSPAAPPKPWLVPFGWRQERRNITGVSRLQAMVEARDKTIAALREERREADADHWRDVNRLEMDVQHARMDLLVVTDRQATAALAVVELLEGKSRQQLVLCESEAWESILHAWKEREDKEETKRKHTLQQHTRRGEHGDGNRAGEGSDAAQRSATVVLELITSLEASQRRCLCCEEAEEWENHCLLSWRVYAMRQEARAQAAVRKRREWGRSTRDQLPCEQLANTSLLVQEQEKQERGQDVFPTATSLGPLRRSRSVSFNVTDSHHEGSAEPERDEEEVSSLQLSAISGTGEEDMYRSNNNKDQAHVPTLDRPSRQQRQHALPIPPNPGTADRRDGDGTAAMARSPAPSDSINPAVAQRIRRGEEKASDSARGAAEGSPHGSDGQLALPGSQHPTRSLFIPINPSRPLQ